MAINEKLNDNEFIHKNKKEYYLPEPFDATDFTVTYGNGSKASKEKFMEILAKAKPSNKNELNYSKIYLKNSDNDNDDKFMFTNEFKNKIKNYEISNNNKNNSFIDGIMKNKNNYKNNIQEDCDDCRYW